MKRKIVGHKIADQLFAAEAAIDTALSAVAAPDRHAADRAYRGRPVSGGRPRGCSDRSCETLTSLTEARRGIVEQQAHRCAARIGLGAVALGGTDKPEETFRRPEGLLRPVRADPSGRLRGLHPTGLVNGRSNPTGTPAMFSDHRVPDRGADHGGGLSVTA